MVGAVLNRGRILHYLEIFAAAFAVTAAANGENLMGAHGLNAAKSVAIAALVAGGKAVLEAYRKSTAKATPKPAVAAPVVYTSSGTNVTSYVPVVVSSPPPPDATPAAAEAPAPPPDPPATAAPVTP